MTDLWSARPRGLQAVLLGVAGVSLVLAVMARNGTAACGWFVVITQTLSLGLWRSTADRNLRRIAQRISLPLPTETFGPCRKCGLEQTRNPHPQAGGLDPDDVNVGYAWECIPCLVRARNEAQGRVRAAHAVCDDGEWQATRWEDPLPVPAWVERVRTALTGGSLPNPPEAPNGNAPQDGAS